MTNLRETIDKLEEIANRLDAAGEVGDEMKNEDTLIYTEILELFKLPIRNDAYNPDSKKTFAIFVARCSKVIAYEEVKNINQHYAELITSIAQGVQICHNAVAKSLLLLVAKLRNDYEESDIYDV